MPDLVKFSQQAEFLSSTCSEGLNDFKKGIDGLESLRDNLAAHEREYKRKVRGIRGLWMVGQLDG